MRVLIIADEKSSSPSELIDILNRNGNDASRVRAEHITPEIIGAADIILIDQGLPDSEAIAVRYKIGTDNDVPIIALSNTTPRGLNDVLAQLVATAGSKERDRAPTRPNVVRIGDLTVSIKNLKVTVGDNTVELTKKEFQILALLATEEGTMCSREKIAAEAWGLPEADVHDSIHVLVSRLRAKLGHDRIRTVRSVGYQLVAVENPLRT